jgi:hypothetical protein
MGCELFVALLLVLNHHLVNRFANGRPCRVKHPRAI